MSSRNSVQLPSKRRRGSMVSAVKEQYSDDGDSDSGDYNQQNQSDKRPLAVTCTFCRARKIKCDNIKPACANCVKAGNDCVYLAKQKPGLKAGTGETMLRRIDALESEFNSYRQLMDYRINELEGWRVAMSTNPSSQSPSSGSMYPAMLHMHQPNPGQPEMMGDAMQTNNMHADTPRHVGTGLPFDLNPMFNSQQRTGSVNNSYVHPKLERRQSMLSPLGRSNTLSRSVQPNLQASPVYQPAPSPNLQSLIARRESQQRYDIQDQVSNHDYLPTTYEEEPVWRPGSTLPRDDIVRHLIELYFERIAPSTFFISPDQAETWEPPWNIVVYGIVSLTVRFSDDERIAPFKSEIQEETRKYVYLEMMNRISFEGLQALTLLSIDVIGGGKGIESWGCISLLTRSAVIADLLRESGTDNVEITTGQYNNGRFPSALSKTSILQTPTTWKEDEARRRLFWIIFALDRYTSSATAIDTAIPSADIRRRLPCADDLWRGKDPYIADTFVSPLNLYGRGSASLATLHPAAFFVESLDLMGKAHALQSRSVDIQDPRAMELRKDATAGIVSSATRWYIDILPAIGKIEDKGSIGSLGLLTHGIYHATLLKLQSFHAYPALATTGSIVEPYASACLESARAIVSLSCRATANQSPRIPYVSPIFIWCCWIAARILFVNSCLGAQIQIDADFQVIVQSMQVMAKQWPLADEYVRLLLRAERKWHALATDMHHSPASGSLSEAVSVLLDLKKTGAQALKLGAYDVTPPEPVRASELGPFGAATPNWPRPNVPTYGEVQNWFDSLELFNSPYDGMTI